MARLLTVYKDLIFIDYLMMTSTPVPQNFTGFTLVEVLMAILVLAVLTTIGVTQFIDFGKDARIAVTQEKLNALKAAIVGDPHFYAAGEYTKPGFQANCSGPPVSLNDLITKPAAGVCSTVYDPYAKTGWRGPYVSDTDPTWNQDGWGTTLQYFVAGPPARTIRSCGSDKICGNTDDISVTF